MKTIKILFFLLTSLNLYAQLPSWHVLPNAPYNNVGRHEDIYFINSTTGWVINLDGSLYKTINGGNSWDTVNHNVNLYLRSTGFFDSNTGIIGTLDSNHILFKTTNGGYNWTEITQSIQGTIPSG